MKKLKTIIFLIIIIVMYVIGAIILNNTNTKVSLPLGLFLIDFFIIALPVTYFAIYFMKKLKKKKKKNFGDKICIVFMCTVIPLYYLFNILPLFIDIFSDFGEVSLINVSIYYKEERKSRFGTYKQYYIKGYDAKKGNVNIKIRVEDDALKYKNEINSQKFTKVYYYKNSNYVYKIETD